ncbi:MAG: AbrB/MazE/SpoVT family DNA-binding domain-containing protein [Cyanobacteria bacterium TGS_CYA1]|nr:AbrB/MazE/SpoVT family DNA-binding domain-containing protein [Cyanobacteria bacterium TGS_CYA1]
MIKRLTKLGNSSALVIDRPIMELLNMSCDVPVEITMGEDGKSLILRAVTDEQENHKKFEAALKQTNKRHGGAKKKLAKR